MNANAQRRGTPLKKTRCVHLPFIYSNYENPHLSHYYYQQRLTSCCGKLLRSTHLRLNPVLATHYSHYLVFVCAITLPLTYPDAWHWLSAEWALWVFVIPVTPLATLLLLVGNAAEPRLLQLCVSSVGLAVVVVFVILNTLVLDDADALLLGGVDSIRDTDRVFQVSIASRSGFFVCRSVSVHVCIFAWLLFITHLFSALLPFLF
jgi:hypothetical protein